jgi:hypothetical protein
MKRFLVAAVGAVTLLGSGAAMAEVDVDISIGIPGIIYDYPHYHRRPPPPPVVVVPAYPYRPVVVYSNRDHRGPHDRHEHWKGKRWKSDRDYYERDGRWRRWDD